MENRCKETDIPDKDVDTWLASKLVPTSFCGQSGVLWTLSGFSVFSKFCVGFGEKSLLMNFWTLMAHGEKRFLYVTVDDLKFGRLRTMGLGFRVTSG